MARMAKPVNSAAQAQAEYVTARQVFVHVVVQTTLDDLEPTPEFVKAIEGAIAKQSPEEQQHSLRQALDSWGHVFATRVELGSMLGATVEYAGASRVSLTTSSRWLMNLISR